MKKGIKIHTKSFYIGLTFLFASIVSPMNVSASHHVGGEITYEWIAGNVYILKAKLYRDCSGITLPQNLNISYKSANCALAGNKTLLMLGTPEQLPLICAAQDSNSTCNGGPLYAVDRTLYQDTIMLPGNCDDWIFSYSSCCRNATITNLNNPGAAGIYFSAHLDNLNHPFNNSVEFGSVPVNVIPVNTTTTLNWNTYDVDGDSLVYELVPARAENAGIPINLTYNTGYTFNQPFLSSVPTSLDAATGLLSVTPNTVQACVVAMKITEYRNGVEVGNVYREMQVVVTNSTNSPPTLSGINGMPNFVINGCPGDTITFDINSNDIDTGQAVTIFMSPNSTNAGFNISGTPFPTGTYTWVPDTTDVSSQPYVVILTAFDDNCPYNGVNTYAYFVYVNGCNTNDVWPGDANSDGTANLYDLLPIGIAYNDNGPVRPNASLNWVAQPSTNWTNSFISGINHKHADTDGDGVINLSDTTAIGQNFGLNHPLRNPSPPSLAATNLTIISSADTVPTSTAVDLTVMLDSPSDSIYGLAFRINFNPSFVMAGSVTLDYTNSIFGTAAIDMIHLERVNYLMGYADISITGIDHVNRFSNGTVVVMSIVTTDNVSGKVSFDIIPSDIVSNDNIGNPLIINGSGTTLTIDPTLTSINEYDLAANFTIYTSLSHTLTYNYTGEGQVEAIEIIDVQGKISIQQTLARNQGDMDTTTLSEGIYYCRVKINGSYIIKKIHVF
jgi:type IX secretion system substrate protein